MQKAVLRKIYLRKRKQLTEEEVARRSGEIARLLAGWMAGKPVSCIHTFLPAAGRNEVDTFRILRLLQAVHPGLDVLVPKVETTGRILSHYRYTAFTALRYNRWGIPEPDAEEDGACGIDEIDMVLVPLLAFDRLGHRVGYGGGYYDVFLAACKPSVLKAGLSLFGPVDRIEDTDHFDIRLDCCFTPGDVYLFNNE